jgi:hypothetical protein
MKYLKLVFGLAMLASMMAVTASSAMAKEPVWVTCLPAKNGAGTGTFEDSHCTKPLHNGNWETSELTKTVEVTSFAKLNLSDTVGKTTVTCTGLGKGTVGAKGSSSVTEISNLSCVFLPKEEGKCEAADGVRAKPLGLPWSGQLVERKNTGGVLELRNSVTSLINGRAPGWGIECTVDKVLQVDDECTGNSTAGIRANRAEGSVESEAEKESEKANCSLGGTGAGESEGITTIKLRMSSGELLAFWPLAEAIRT